ncbi:hypothetical protein POG22_23890 [Geitlerinema sp. CS-897]|nr:hypothetical protein [Geitlerinema sp. CS-897]
MNYFSGQDLKLIESLVYQPELEPSYEAIKDVLIWSDERPNGLSFEGYEKLCDLWVARSFIHRKVSFLSCKLDSTYFEEVWRRAVYQEFRWPGFYRFELKDRLYYKKQRAETQDFI